MGLRAKAREAGAEVKQGLLRVAGLQGKPLPETTRPRALSSGSFSPNLLCARLPHKLVRTQEELRTNWGARLREGRCKLNSNFRSEAACCACGGHGSYWYV